MRQYKLFVCFIQVILFVQPVLSGFERNSQPTAAFSMAFSGVGMFLAENLWINPASIAQISNVQLSLFYSPSPFHLKQLSNYGLISAYHSSVANISFGVQSFGFSLYKESLVSIGTAKMVTDGLSIGLNTQLYHVSIDRYGSSSTAVIDLGAIYSATDKINVGLAIQNVTGSTFGEDDDIPRGIVTGLSYTIEEIVTVNGDLIKDIRYPVFYRMGIILQPVETITVSAGSDGSTSRLFGGIGILVSPFKINYGIATHAELGLIHSIGITFQ